MYSTHKATIVARGFATMLVLTAVTAPAWAQGEIRVVTHVRLKPDKGGDFVAAAKDMVELQKKGGADRPYTVWQALTGPREYVVVGYLAKWADLDRTMDPNMKEHQGAMTAIVARLNASTESMETEIHTMVPELTAPRGAEPPKFVRAGRTTVAPGKINDVLELFKAQLLPAWKKSGLAAYGVGRVRYGAPTNQLHTFVGLNGWADLDGPTPGEKGMGPEGFQKYLATMGTLSPRTEWTIYRFRPELSYIPVK